MNHLCPHWQIRTAVWLIAACGSLGPISESAAKTLEVTIVESCVDQYVSVTTLDFRAVAYLSRLNSKQEVVDPPLQ